MLEILLMISLCRRIGAEVRQKGHDAGIYQILAVALWIGGEMLGGFIGGLLAPRTAATRGQPDFCYVYLLAIFGAAIGAAVAYSIASSVTPLQKYPLTESEFDRNRPPVPPPAEEPLWALPAAKEPGSLETPETRFGVEAHTTHAPPPPRPQVPIGEKSGGRIAVVCNGCDGVFPATPELAGRTVRCPHCGGDLYVPLPGEGAGAAAPSVAPSEAATHLRKGFSLVLWTTVLGWLTLGLTAYVYLEFSKAYRQTVSLKERRTEIEDEARMQRDKEIRALSPRLSAGQRTAAITALDVRLDRELQAQRAGLAIAQKDADERNKTWLLGIQIAPLVTLIAWLATLLASLSLLGRLWEEVPSDLRTCGPGVAVGLCVVPLLNLFGVFVAFVGLTRSLNRTAEQAGLPRRTAPAAAFGFAALAASALGVALLVAVSVLTTEDLREFSELWGQDFGTISASIAPAFRAMLLAGLATFLAASVAGLATLASQVRLAREIVVSRGG